jgi:hypothetical protein
MPSTPSSTVIGTPPRPLGRHSAAAAMATAPRTPDSIRSNITTGTFAMGNGASPMIPINIPSSVNRSQQSTPMSSGLHSTKSNMLALQLNQHHDDSDFEEVMRQRTKMRREREDQAVAELRTQVSRLEAALAAESRRRVAAVLALQQECTAQLQATEERLVVKMAQDRAASEERLVQIDRRLEALETQWQTDMQRTEQDLNQQTGQLTACIEQLRGAQEQERSSRLQREGKLLQQMEELSLKYEEQWKTERQERLDTAAMLTGRMDDQDRERDELVHDYTDRLRNELTALQMDLQQETVDRLYQDEEIVGALNRYTAQLQKSLSFIVSDV